MCSLKILKLENVSFGNSIKLIGQSAFENCVNIKKVTHSRWSDKINGFAFEGCSSLEKIAIPDTITDIGMRAFL
ncbi:MAG: leucine-rich repeat protein [Ruminococcus sp.]